MEEERSPERLPQIFTAKKGTSFYSGPYPDGGELIGRAEEDMKIGVFTDKKDIRRSSIGWIFFPTTHRVAYGGDESRKIQAWVAKTSWRQKGFVRL